MYLFWRSFLKSEENSHYSCIKDFNIFMFNKEEDNEKHIRLQYFSSEELEDRKKNMKIEKAAKMFLFQFVQEKSRSKKAQIPNRDNDNEPCTNMYKKNSACSCA